jgi:hypothetical protein
MRLMKWPQRGDNHHLESLNPIGSGFAIRRPDATSLDTANQLGKAISAAVPPVVPSSSDLPPTVSLPPELSNLVAAWPDLPPVVRAGILAMVAATEGHRKDGAPSQ